MDQGKRIEKNTAENMINKKDQNFNSSEIIKKSIINNFKKNYTIFLNRKGKNTFDINLMKLIYTEITILMGETLNLDLKARNKFLLPRMKILKKIPKNNGNLFIQFLRYFKNFFN